VDADFGGPAHAAGLFPVDFDRGTLGQQNDDAPKVCHEQTGHGGVQQNFEAPGVFDPQEEEADGNLEQTGRCEEEDLGVKAQHVVVDVVVATNVHLVPAVAMSDLHGLYPGPGYRQD
jgi:hypothetical protein